MQKGKPKIRTWTGFIAKEINLSVTVGCIERQMSTIKAAYSFN
jgi:hypothetical protein